MSFVSPIVSTHELRLLPMPSVVQRPSLMEAKALSQLVNDSRLHVSFAGSIPIFVGSSSPVAAFLTQS